MAEKKESVTYASLRNEILNGKFRPIYVLAGEEPFYIDRLSELIVQQALSDDERDFNLAIFYGNEADVREVIASCKQFPAFAQRRVVVLREAQLVPKQAGHKEDLDLFMHYAQAPLASTILVICNKGGALKSKPFLDALKQTKNGVVMSSDKVRTDADMRSLVASYATSLGCNIDAKSTAMLAEFIGNDLSRLFGELDKLSLLVGDNRAITPELIERNIGISKDYNTFELGDALKTRNAFKAYRIIDYFERNPKNNPVQMVVPYLFSFFSKLLVVNAAKGRPDQATVENLGIKSAYQLRGITDAMRYYNTPSCVKILRDIRECDVKSKGIGSRQDSYALLRELVYKILHS